MSSRFRLRSLEGSLDPLLTAQITKTQTKTEIALITITIQLLYP